MTFTPNPLGAGGSRREPPDPVYSAIEAHRKAVAVYRLALDRLAGLRPGPELDAARAITDRVSDILGLVGVELAEVKPTTFWGLAAWARYVGECSRGDAEQWLLPFLDNEDDDGCSHALFTVAEGIERLLRAEA